MNIVFGIFITVDFELLHQDTIFILNRQIKNVDLKNPPIESIWNLGKLTSRKFNNVIMLFNSTRISK